MSTPSTSIFYTAAMAILATFFLFLMGVLGKTLSDTQTPIEVVFWRNFFGTFFLFPFIISRFRGRLPPMGKPRKMLARGVLGTLTLALSMGAYFHLPLAEANAILLSSPLILTLLASTLLKEQVTHARFLCTACGLIGVLIVAQPSGQLSPLGTLLAVSAALLVAFMRVLLRQLGKTEDPLAVVFYFMLIGMIVSFPVLFFSEKLPTIKSFYILATIGACGAFGQYLNGLSYKHGEASYVGIFIYTQLIWAIVFDYILWGQVPLFLTLLGGVLIVGSSLWSIRCERIKQRKMMRTTL